MPIINTFKCKKCGYEFDSMEEWNIKEIKCTNPKKDENGKLCNGIAIKQYKSMNFESAPGFYNYENKSRSYKIKKEIDRDPECK